MDDPAADTSLISALESLCAQLEDNTSKSEEQIEAELAAAFKTTKSVIQQCLPNDDERAKWDDELVDLIGNVAKHGDEPLKSKSNKTCAGCRKQIDLKSVALCIHGCGVAYCAAKCRKADVAHHKQSCEALKRKALLKKLDIPQSDELF